MLIRAKQIRYQVSDPGPPGPKLSNLDAVLEAWGEIAPQVDDGTREVVVALYLNPKNELRGWHVVALGHETAATFTAGSVLRPAIMVGATAVILIHTHPSGHPEPSPDDDHITRKIAAACDVCDVTLHDHVIIGDGAVYSYAEAGKLREWAAPCYARVLRCG